MSDTAESHIVLGHISSLYGIKGWVKIFSYTQPRKNILHYSPWWLNQQDRIEIETGRVHGKGIVAKFSGVDDREAATRFLNMKISVPRTSLETLPHDEYYWIDLVGLQVINQNGESLGQVSQLFATGANDVVVVKDKKTEHLLPFLKWVVLDIDLPNGVMRVDWDTDF